MSTENPNNADLHDRLIDNALREVVGGETPPDLSEQILFAVTGQQSEQLATLEKGTDAMNSSEIKLRRKRNLWIGAAVAASLLVVGTLFLPLTRYDKQQLGKSTEPSREPFASAASSNPQDLQPRNSATTWNSTTGRSKKLDNQADATDFDSLTELITGTVDSETMQEREGEVEPFPENLDLVISQTQQVHEKNELQADGLPGLTAQGARSSSASALDLPQAVEAKEQSANNDSLMMAVTPSIIIEAESEEPQLGAIVYPDTGKSEVSPLRRQKYKRNLSSPTAPLDAYQESDDYAATALQPSQDKIAARPAASKAPDSGLNFRGAGQRFRIDSAPGQDVDRFQLSMGFGTQQAPQGAGAGGGGLGGGVGGALGGGVGGGVGGGASDGKFAGTRINKNADASGLFAFADPALIVEQRKVAKEVREKIGRYSKAAAQLDGAESALAESVRERLDREAQGIRRKIQRFESNSDEQQIEQLAVLEGKLADKVAEIELARAKPRRLARLSAEIKQLQDLEEKLERKRRALDPEHGRGPSASGDKYERIYENPFIAAEGDKAVSTFSIDVDTASYANVRQFLMQSAQLPPPDAVRIEELVNYFDYDYTAPTGDTPFAAHVEVAGCPWKADHRLVRVGIKGREIETENRPQSNLVFLIDVSGSMNEPAKLPLLVEGMKLLTRELGENDRVAIVVYASSEGLALPSTRGDKQDTILAALEKLRAGGSTAGGAGITLAYKIAQDNYIEGGVNRVILATDGDFNVGITSPAALQELAESNAKETGVFLTVLGFGRGNLNDAMMEQISGKGNGNYHYIDNQTEARKVLVAEMAGTLVTIAKDVKIQIEFNPAQVSAYRLIGYENRMLKTQDFNDDKKDAGEIGAGHTVTAIYELVPAGKTIDTPAVDPLKYQRPAKTQNDADSSDELLTLKMRYKQPDGDKSTKLEFPISDNGQAFAAATDDFKFAAAVASFGMQLRNSEHQGHTSYSAVEEIAQDGAGADQRGYRAEFLQLVRQAKALAGE